MVKTVTVTVPLVWLASSNTDPSHSNRILDNYLNSGYRVKFMETFILTDTAYAHYVLEKEE